MKTRTDELDLKLQLKRLGDADFKAENQLLLQQVTDRITDLYKANGITSATDLFQANGLKYDSPGQRPDLYTQIGPRTLGGRGGNFSETFLYMLEMDVWMGAA